MRVLTLGNLYPPHHYGGYELVWEGAVGHLRARGHEVRVLATDYRLPGVSDVPQEGVHRELRWYGFGDAPAPLSVSDRLRVERHNHAAIARHLAELEPAVVSFWSMGGMSHSLIEKVRRARIPFVAFVSDEWLDYGRRTDEWTRLFRGRRRWAAPIAEALTGIPARVRYSAGGRWVFVSRFIRDKAAELDPEFRHGAIAHTGIDPLFLEPGPAHAWQWRLLYVGRLHSDKGIQDALGALSHLPDARLSIAGSWTAGDEASLQEHVRARGLADRVELLGQLPRTAVASLYRDHDALLFPVRWGEPWGLVPLEAMGGGCPVVATGRGGSGEYLRDGENCLLAPAEDPRGLAAAVHRLATDPALRERLRHGGLATAPRHTKDIFNAAVEHHLLEAAAPDGRAPHPVPA